MRGDLPLTVVIDASCPMGRSAIPAIKVQDSTDHLRRADCSTTGFDAAAFHQDGVPMADMMTRLHRASQACDNGKCDR